MTDAEANQLLRDELRHVRQDRLKIARQRDLLLEAVAAAISAAYRKPPTLEQYREGMQQVARGLSNAMEAAIAECEDPTPPAA